MRHCEYCEASEAKIERLLKALEDQEHAWRDREAIGNESGQALVNSLKARLADAHAALRSIAEGNLGDQPWQANYETVKQVARNALKDQPK